MGDGGLSGSRLARMRDTLARHVGPGQVPGLVALVARRGEVHVETLGVQAVGGTPVARDTLFRVASMTKPVTAVAAMILVEECRLRLDDPVDGLLPELAGRRVLSSLDARLDDTVPAHRPITVRDLLTFRMGFGVVMAPPGTYPIQRAADELELGQGPPRPSVPPAPDEWIRRLGTLPLIHQPGERWMYNTGSDVLGVLIARAAGQPFEAFLRERVFEPLGMRDTGFSVPADQLHRLATSYAADPATGALTVYDEAAGGDWSRPPAFPSGGGGLVSTADDFLAFGRMMLAHGRYGSHRILSRPSVETMVTDQLTPAQKPQSGPFADYFAGHGWGFGLSVATRRTDPAAPVGRFGWDGGLGTSWSTDPREELVTVLLTQRNWTSPHPPDVCRDFWTSAYQAIDD
ncbi:CubicO group peptidase (beta-lactamase class C family) [Kitasatospora sp. MAA4]|uniref:serine hydrolase domain-containing protein n=1 Tax=Kitasatospora sp. MAA4 TaxID=3035093 RepID=UPI002476413C|nr:serine hydrolase domain-containing protein [Kitasatospora sp. MAA4]MDH6133641.1 CubicO group peptidase (beta-lactamase class C family) [Kitasatospora sp. MAA4]